MLSNILAAVVVQLGVSADHSLKSDSEIDYREDFALHAKVGTDTQPFYGWTSVSKGEHYILGQNISDSYNLSGGIGYRHDYDNNLYILLEAGVGYPHNVSNFEIQQEVAYTYLVGRHAVENRPIPVEVQFPYDQDSYSTTWELDYGLVLKAGVGFEVSEHWDISLSYKYFNPKGLIEIYDEESRAAGLGWWQEYVSVNMNVVELAVMFEF